MYYIVQENVFREQNYENLILNLERLELPYEIVKVIPFVDTIEFNTERKDIFPFGSLKMARVSNQYGWTPGSQMNQNHDFQVYKEYYRENLLNWDSKIIKFGDDSFFSRDIFFARPTKDTKVFTGKIFDMGEWEEFKKYSRTNGHSTLLDDNTDVQISTVKNIQKEIRFWIVKGKIATASIYKIGNTVLYDGKVDSDAYDYCYKMIDLFQLNEAFVMDICMINGEYKIVECGCINCAGFYDSDIQKLLMTLEDSF